MENEITEVPKLIKVMWLIGFSISTVGFIFQLLIYFLIPCTRKLDTKILTILTVTRLSYNAFEYVVTCVTLDSNALNSAIFALYVQSDAAHICWMFVFTKNLYDGIMYPFAQKSNFNLMIVIIWGVTIPIGLLCPLMLEMDYEHFRNHRIIGEYFITFYMIYAYVKFTVLIINLLLFAVIFKIAISRNDRVVNVLRTCVVSFILVSISSVHVLLIDLLSAFADEVFMDLVFGVINSYQVIAITVVFIILVQNKCEDTSQSSLRQKIAKKFMKQTI